MFVTFSCSATLTESGTDTGADEDLTFSNIADKLLLLDDGSYDPSPYSKDGKTYSDKYRTHTFVESVSETKAIYKLRGRDFYYGHEIKSGTLYITESIATNSNSINWEHATKIGSFVNDYSDSFLNNAIGKKLSACENYFDPYTGGTYISKGNATDDKFNFKQASSSTKAIYQHNKSNNFIGLNIVNGDLHVTHEDPNVNSLNKINWNSYTNAGRLQ